jgi:hypothetical protein
MLCHNSLTNYYKVTFQLVQHNKYSLTEVESMLPWELEIYLNQLIDHLNELARQQK